MTADEFFDLHRDRMVRRGDWLRAAELNLLDPSEGARPFKVLLVRLSTYEDTALSITHHYLYALLAARGHYPDRAFLPPGRDEALWAEAGVPWLTGVQSRWPGQAFGLIAVSNAVAQEMGNLLWFLKNSGWPVAARDRRDREDLPLVVLGGANAPFSSLFWGPDSPVDLVFLGEHRPSMEALFDTVARGRAEGLDKTALLERLATLPGVLIPGEERPVAVPAGRDTLCADLLAAMPVALGEGNAGKAHLALSGGCAGFCSFCAESWTRKPYTEAGAADLARQALRVKAGQGASKLDLFSFNFNMHAGLYPFLEAVVPWFSALGLKSQRFDSLAADPSLLDLEKLFGKTWFTCGLEGISDRMRRVLNKNLHDDQLRRAFGVFARSGVRELKAFLIATGWETEEDYAEFGRLLAWLRTLPGAGGRGLNVVFSVTPLVCFPHTPLEFEPAPDAKEVDRSARRILRTAKEQGFEGRVAAAADEAAVCDQMLRPRHPATYATWAATVLEGGFVYRDEIPNWFIRHWQQRLGEAGPFDPSAPRPWARASFGVTRGFLEGQHRRNRGAQELTPQGLIRDSKADQALVRRFSEAWKARAASEVVVSIAVTISPRGVAAGRDQVGAAVARALMFSHEVLAQGYRGYRGSLWAGTEAFCALGGDDSLSLAFLPTAATLLQAWGPEDWARASALTQGFATLKGTTQLGRDQPWEIRAVSPWPLDGERLLNARGLKHTLRRDGPLWRYDLAPAALKKDWLNRLEGQSIDGEWVYTLVPGKKFEWRTLLEEGFRYPPEGGQSRVSLSARAGLLPPR